MQWFTRLQIPHTCIIQLHTSIFTHIPSWDSHNPCLCQCSLTLGGLTGTATAKSNHSVQLWSYKVWKKSWCIEACLDLGQVKSITGWLKKRVWTTRTHTRTGHLSGKYISWLAPVNISIQYLGLESKGAGCLRRAKTWHQYNQQIWVTGATYINYNPKKKKNIVEPVELLKHAKN